MLIIIIMYIFILAYPLPLSVMPIPLVKVWHMGKLGICPEMLQIVVGSYLWLEDVNHYVHKVHRYPLVVAETCHVDWLFAHVLAADVAH